LPDQTFSGALLLQERGAFVLPSIFQNKKKRPPALCRILHPKTEMTLDCFIFSILVFLYKLGSSAVKGHFHSFLVSNIILCTSLSIDLARLSSAQILSSSTSSGTFDIHQSFQVMLESIQNSSLVSIHGFL